ncbi:uncharacterized protein LOC107846555 [Capsicum annuum]|uniref:uncharacterized protein LOC107846555 n=1 Tax=Capsicum annuum TaxID=4072 RepID=UPI001FB071C9|nr:uncharacterized protein LOC107846555 [Capsicum annuum]
MDSDWCEQIKFHLGVLDLDVTLYSEKPTAITEASSDEEKSYYKHWDRSNRLGLMFIRMNIAGNIKTTLPKTDSAKELLKLVEESSQTADKSLAGTLMAVAQQSNQQEQQINAPTNEAIIDELVVNEPQEVA